MKKLIYVLLGLVILMLLATPYFLSKKKEYDLEQCKLTKRLYSQVEVIYSDGCYINFGNGVFISSTGFDNQLYTREQILKKSDNAIIIQ